VNAQVQESGASAPEIHFLMQHTLWFPKQALAEAAFDDLGETWIWYGLGGDDESEWGYISDWVCSLRAEADASYLNALAKHHGGEYEGPFGPDDDPEEWQPCDCVSVTSRLSCNGSV
jgi:hypothetical protein